MAHGDYDYAAELFLGCVKTDSSNPFYVQGFLENLKKKYGTDKKGTTRSQFRKLKARGTMKQAVGEEKWEEVVLSRLDVLLANPWDLTTLKAMATASAKMGEDGAAIVYLKTALESDSNDPDANRQLSDVLARLESDEAP